MFLQNIYSYLTASLIQNFICLDLAQKKIKFLKCDLKSDDLTHCLPADTGYLLLVGNELTLWSGK